MTLLTVMSRPVFLETGPETELNRDLSGIVIKKGVIHRFDLQLNVGRGGYNIVTAKLQIIKNALWTMNASKSTNSQLW